MRFFLLTLIAAFVSAKKEEIEQRRIFCGGFCIATLITTLAIGAGAAAADNEVNGRKKRRRRIDGTVVDTVCTETMKLVREMPYLRELLTKEGEGNILPLVETVEAVKEACAKLAEDDPKMNQCTFYISAAELLDVDLLESVWLSAYGSEHDQHLGCGKVVNEVNKSVGNIAGVRRAELENGQEVYITGDESTTAWRRLIGASVSGAIGAGMYLAHICKSFDESNNLIGSEETIAWN